MQIKRITNDTEEVRVTPNDPQASTHIFTRQGYAGTSVGGGATLDYLKDMAVGLSVDKNTLDKDAIAILTLCFNDYHIEF